jgi:hypothetical protein
MNAPASINCQECRHIFLRYARDCPECGWVRPRGRKMDRPMVASLIGSVVAIGMTFTMVVKYKTSNSAAPAGVRGPIATR